MEPQGNISISFHDSSLLLQNFLTAMLGHFCPDHDPYPGQLSWTSSLLGLSVTEETVGAPSSGGISVPLQSYVYIHIHLKLRWICSPSSMH